MKTISIIKKIKTIIMKMISMTTGNAAVTMEMSAEQMEINFIHTKKLFITMKNNSVRTEAKNIITGSSYDIMKTKTITMKMIADTMKEAVMTMEASSVISVMLPVYMPLISVTTNGFPVTMKTKNILTEIISLTEKITIFIDKLKARPMHEIKIVTQTSVVCSTSRIADKAKQLHHRLTEPLLIHNEFA